MTIAINVRCVCLCVHRFYFVILFVSYIFMHMQVGVKKLTVNCVIFSPVLLHWNRSLHVKLVMVVT